MPTAKQHTLQFGFTEKLSPSMAALICTEVLANNKDKSEDTYVATVDVQKAFDSVFHPSLLRKLFIATEADATWPLFSYLLHNIEVKVRIGPLKSKCVTLNQGVGQGRIPSTSQYKLHLDRLLSTLESSGLGSHIGPFYCGAPTCADDVLLVADSHNELQAQLDIICHYSRQERYMINPTKTTVSVYPSKRSPTPGAQHKWKLCDEEVAPTEHFTHLGINRSAGKLSPEVLINTRLQLARNTRYALMGAGLHGSNGISPAVAWSMYSTYVLPRLIFNMEVLILTQSQIVTLEKFHRATLRSIQGLPERTSSALAYLLLGALPVEAVLHSRVLLLAGKILHQKDSLLFKLGLRQLAVKNFSSKSWFVYATRIAGRYDLPSLHALIDSNISERRWRYLVKSTIQKHWQESLLHDAASKAKSSLRHVHVPSLRLGSIHPVWHYVKCQMRDINRGRIKAKLLGGTYTLQATKARFNASEVDATCQLCQSDPEDTEHFILSCPAHAAVRQSLLPQLQSEVPTNIWKNLASEPAAFTSCILDSNAACHMNLINKDNILNWEFQTRILCYALHTNRSKLLEARATSTASAPDDTGCASP